MENIDNNISLINDLDESSNLNLLKENVSSQSKNILELWDLSVKNWSEVDIEKVFTDLEIKCWAPWLSASKNSLEWRAKVFEEWQFILTSWDNFLASLSTNLINWDWNKDSLKSWDEVAWDPTTFENTYEKNGNSLVLMSMNVNPLFRWLWLPNILIENANKLAEKLWLDYIIWSFRPSWYWSYKIDNNYDDFDKYIKTINQNWELIDPWLKVLTRNWMKMIKVDENAMVIELTEDEFEKLDKQNWVYDWEKYECLEVWSWTKTDNWTYLYKESNVWWVLDFNKWKWITSTI